MRHGQRSLNELAEYHGIKPKTVAKGRKCSLGALKSLGLKWRGASARSAICLKGKHQKGTGAGAAIDDVN
jgi:hypothetical protein